MSYYKNDPLYQFIDRTREGRDVKLKIHDYFKSEYVAAREGYRQWAGKIDKTLSNIGIIGYKAGITKGKIFKAIEQELNIDLNKEKNIENSKQQHIYFNSDLRELFESYIQQVVDESDYDNKIYNVYFALNFWARDGMFVKIGISKDVARRLKQLNSYTSDKWELLGVIEKCEKSLEAEIQRKFDKYNCRMDGEREKFYLTSEILDYAENNCTQFNKQVKPLLIDF